VKYYYNLKLAKICEVNRKPNIQKCDNKSQVKSAVWLNFPI